MTTCSDVVIVKNKNIDVAPKMGGYSQNQCGTPTTWTSIPAGVTKITLRVKCREGGCNAKLKSIAFDIFESDQSTPLQGASPAGDAYGNPSLDACNANYKDQSVWQDYSVNSVNTIIYDVSSSSARERKVRVQVPVFNYLVAMHTASVGRNIRSSTNYSVSPPPPPPNACLNFNWYHSFALVVTTATGTAPTCTSRTRGRGLNSPRTSASRWPPHSAIRRTARIGSASSGASATRTASTMATSARRMAIRATAPPECATARGTRAPHAGTSTPRHRRDPCDADTRIG